MVKKKVESEESKVIGTVTGKITSGKLKGRPFSVFIGKSPGDTQVVVSGEIVMCTKIQINIDREKQVNEIKLDCWLMPEEL